jgi:hypothetical protein
MAEGLRIEYVALKDVQKWARNPKLHAAELIEKSVSRFGFVDPILLDERANTLVAGHGRIAALEALKAQGGSPPERIRVRADGEWEVPVIRGVRFNSEAEMAGYAIADNRLVEKGGWDEILLGKLMSDLNKVVDFGDLGWTDEQVEKFRKAGETDPTVQYPGDGKKPEQAREVYETGDARQIVLVFAPEEFVKIERRFDELQAELKTDSRASVLKKLLEAYEKNRSGTAQT